MTDARHSEFIAALFGKQDAPGNDAEQAPEPQQVEQAEAEDAALEAEVAELEHLVSELELPENLRTWREEAARRHKLPPALADRLRGSDAGAIDTDARKVAESLASPPSAEQVLLERLDDRRARRLQDLLPGEPGLPMIDPEGGTK